MTRIRLSIYLILCCLVMSVLAAPARAKDKWINLTTKNFNIISNADEGPSRRLALKLEQFHFVFSTLFNLPLQRPIPTTVIVFKHDASFKPYKPLYNGKPANVAGYFQPSEDQNLIALDISANQEHPMSVIFHEYTHLLTSATPRQWPIWLKEGLAELYSTFEVEDNKATLGAVISRHVLLLRDKTMIPLQSLLTVHHDSPLYNERDKQGIFYAESWAFCHYLLFADKSVRRPQLAEFASLINRGVADDPAFTHSFKITPAEMEKQIRSYVNRSSYTANIYTLTSTEGEKDIAVRPVSDGEAQSYLGDLLARTNRLDEAVGILKQAAAAEPDLARPHEGLGLVAMRRNNYPEALEEFKQASTRGSKSHLAHYYYAQSLQRQVERNITPDVAKTIGDELRTSIKLMPGFAYAHAMLGFLSLETGQNLKEGAESLATAVRLEPQNKRFVLNLAQLQVRMQDYAAAKKTVEPILAGDDPALKSSAESILRMIDYASRGSEIRQEPSQVTSDNTDTDSKPTTNTAPKLVRKPTINIEGAQSMRGVLVNIECKANKWTLVVNTKDDLLKFTVSDKDQLQFYEDGSRVAGIECGTINRIAVIYFKPPTGQAKTAGEAVAVEFTQ